MTRAYPVEITPPARRNIREAAAWWRKNRPAAPGAVREELAKIYSLIATSPHVGAKVEDADLESVRKLYVERIHYHLYYRFNETKQIVEVLALWHASRGHGP